MSTKRVLQPYRLVNSVETPANLGGNFVSKPVNAMLLDNCGLQISWTSTNAVGVVSVEASIDYDEHSGAGSFYALSFDPGLTQPASNNGGYLVNLNQLPFKWFRVRYVRGSGTGALDVWVCSKGLS